MALFPSLHALLQTIRVFQRHEDDLCTFLHELQTLGALSAGTRRELRELLEELPTEAYLHELGAVHQALVGTRASGRPVKKQQLAPSRGKRGKARAKPKTR